MRFKVPKDVDIEDRIVGPLTIKQLGWIGGGFLLCVGIWQMADVQLAVFLGIIIMASCGAFAFLRPYNQSLVGFFGSVFVFLTKPKQYLWRRMGFNFPRNKNTNKKDRNIMILMKKGFPTEEVEKLTKTIDSGGTIT